MTSKTTCLANAGSIALALLAVSSLLAPQDAQACGGLFCNSNQQVNQAAERIIFVDREDGTVTAVVQIQYQGEADQFSWVLPVPGIPEVGVSSNQAFQALQNATNPIYTLNTQVEGECRPDDRLSQDVGISNADQDSGGFEPDMMPGGGVNVLDRGQVGPYDYEVISVQDGMNDVAQVAIEWLTDNGYDVTDIGPDVLRPYLLDGMNLIAFRLTKQADAGSIRPVRLTYESDSPMIPIKPTAVAANDDMGIMTFIGAPSRAVPTNYRHLVLNDAAINWFNPASNYNDVINLAADQAGGQGFVTEFAGPSEGFSETIFGSALQFSWDSLKNGAWQGAEGQLLSGAVDSFGPWDGFADVLRATVPPPEGVTEEEFLSCPLCVYDRRAEDIEGMEIDAFLQSLEENVIEPMRATQALVNEMPYMTRLFTTMSALEMTLDPAFITNPDLSEHDNQHLATRTIECSPAVLLSDAPWRVEFDNGTVVRGLGASWPIADGQLPANARIEQLDGEGEAEVVLDNLETIEQRLEENNARFPPPSSTGDDDPNGDGLGGDQPGGGPSGDGGSDSGDGCACSVPTAPASAPGLPAALIALAFGALVAVRRQ